MTASREREGGGLHKRWLERRLDIEVGKVTSKLQSKGLTVPEPNAEALEAHVCMAQTHLPKLCIDLRGRNPNGTVKVLPPPPRPPPPKPPTVVQKLDEALDPSQLTALPHEIAMAHGLLLPFPAVGSHLTANVRRAGSPTGQSGRPGMPLPLHQLSSSRPQQQQQQQQQPQQVDLLPVGGSSSGGAAPLQPPAHPHRSNSSHPSEGAEAGATSGGGAGGANAPPLTARSGPPGQVPGPGHPGHVPQIRPDLQAADARIDAAMAEVQRVAMQANEMSPRARVLYLAKQANPDFELVHPPPRVHRSTTMAHGRLRREFTRRSTKRFIGFNADAGSGGEGSMSTHGRSPLQHQSESRHQPAQHGEGLQAAPSMLQRAHGEARSKDGAAAQSSPGPKSEGHLPPLSERSRSVDRHPSDGSSGKAAHANTAPGSLAGDVGASETLPKIAPDRRHSSGDTQAVHRASADTGPLPPLPARHSPVDLLATFTDAAASNMVNMWEVAAHTTQSVLPAASVERKAVSVPSAEKAAPSPPVEDSAVLQAPTAAEGTVGVSELVEPKQVETQEPA